ncbi:MAG: hypothetical protein MGF17_16960 [Trichodesmium sp. MAG_R04]|nr:hypothetical protein [Trichodesmium sp. MAG_R04]
MPDSFHIKIVTISRKADGYYVTLSLDGKSVSALTTVVKLNLENTLAIDMRLKDFLITSQGELVQIPQYYRKSRKRLQLYKNVYLEFANSVSVQTIIYFEISRCPNDCY